MIAEDVMTREPVTVTESVSIADALEVLSDEAIRHLPVVRGADIVGILSDRDFRALGVTGVRGIETYERLRGRLSEPVSALMTSSVVTVDRDAELSEVIELMLDEKLSAVPVVESETTELVGIVSYIDVLRATLPLIEAEAS